jgi:hypothetical protein
MGTATKMRLAMLIGTSDRVLAHFMGCRTKAGSCTSTPSEELADGVGGLVSSCSIPPRRPM